MTKEEIINSIDWDKDFQELSPNHQAYFLSLYGFPGLHPDLLGLILEKYENAQWVVQERGKDKLHLYI